MNPLVNVNRSTVRHARNAAANLVEAYRALAARGVGLQATVVNRGTESLGARITIVDPALGSLRRVNAQANAFAAAVVDGLATQATAIVNGVANLANYAAGKQYPGMKLALPVANPINLVARRVDLASSRLVAAVAPQPARRAKRR